MNRVDIRTLGTIARALEDAPLHYRQGLAASAPRERLHTVDTLAGWIGARLAPPPTYHDQQLPLLIDSGLA